MPNQLRQAQKEKELEREEGGEWKGPASQRPFTLKKVTGHHPVDPHLAAATSKMASRTNSGLAMARAGTMLRRPEE
jgi:hypothetical protein